MARKTTLTASRLAGNNTTLTLTAGRTTTVTTKTTTRRAAPIATKTAPRDNRPDRKVSERLEKIPTPFAPSRAIKMVAGKAVVRVAGRKWTVTSTEAMRLVDSYSPIFQHDRDGEYVFAIECPGVIAARPLPDDTQLELEMGEPFVFAGLRVSGVYRFERMTKEYSRINAGRVMLVACDELSAPAETGTDTRY
jgi:hypothetical protein